jgi:hypothetical protein
VTPGRYRFWGCLLVRHDVRALDHTIGYGRRSRGLGRVELTPDVPTLARFDAALGGWQFPDSLRLPEVQNFEALLSDRDTGNLSRDNRSQAARFRYEFFQLTLKASA